MCYNINNGDNMKKRRIKKSSFVILGILIIIVIISTCYLIKYINYKKTYDYKFKKIGYNETEIRVLKTHLKNKELDKILTLNYNKNIDDFIKEAYFIFNNLNDYLKYQKNNKNKNFSEIISIINVNSNFEFYSNSKKADTSKNELMLVNKYNYLTKEYNPNDLINFSNVYAYGENQKLRKVAYDAYVEMFNAAKKDGLTLIINSSYRSFEEQEKIYNDYSSWYSVNEADKIAARAGYSEHQTGLAVDIQSYCSQTKEFDECEEFTWLKNNAFKYGFILRYPKDLEHLTGYSYESWHYRYVGKDISEYINDKNITFDEYYAYFIA